LWWVGVGGLVVVGVGRGKGKSQWGSGRSGKRTGGPSGGSKKGALKNLKRKEAAQTGGTFFIVLGKGRSGTHIARER